MTSPNRDFVGFQRAFVEPKDFFPSVFNILVSPLNAQWRSFFGGGMVNLPTFQSQHFFLTAGNWHSRQDHLKWRCKICARLIDERHCTVCFEPSIFRSFFLQLFVFYLQECFGVPYFFLRVFVRRIAEFGQCPAHHQIFPLPFPRSCIASASRTQLHDIFLSDF